MSTEFIHDMRACHIYQPIETRRESHLDIRGVKYAVSEWGDADAPLIVFLHGWGDCGATFQFVVDRFADRWHIVAPDFRGFGGSSQRAQAYWFPDYVADLDALLEILSPATPVRIVGHSMGANVAGLYAGAFPDRLRGFVNVEGFGLRDSNPADAPAHYRQWVLAGRAPGEFSVYPGFTALAEKIRRRNPNMQPEYAQYVARCWGREAGDEVRLRADPAHKLPNAVLYRRAESEACWRAVSAPVLLVAGSDSVFADAGDERLATGSLDLPFPNSSLEVIEGAGHMLHFEAPGRLAALIEQFFRPTL